MGAETIIEVQAIRDEIITLPARSGFTIRSWASNDKRIISDLVISALHTNVVLNKDSSLKTE